MKHLTYIFLVSLLFLNCGQDQTFVLPSEQLEIDRKIILDYITKNNLKAVENAFGVFYVIKEEGEGTQKPVGNSTVIIHYKGYFLDGNVFDQTGAEPVQFNLTGTITGWQYGIPEFKKKSKGTLIVPSGYAYGQYGRGSIPGNAILAFDIELINFL